MTKRLATVAIPTRVRAVILWLGGSAVIGSLALGFWYRMTLRRFQEAGDNQDDLPSSANEEDNE
jgi:hypothetical protein